MGIESIFNTGLLGLMGVANSMGPKESGGKGKTAFGKIGEGAVGMGNAAGNLLTGIAKWRNYDSKDNNTGIDAAYDQVGSFIGNFGLPGKAIQTAMKIKKGIDNNFDLQADAISKGGAEFMGMSKGQQNWQKGLALAKNLTGLNYINRAFGDVNRAADLDLYGTQVNGGYTGTQHDRENLQSAAGQNLGRKAVQMNSAVTGFDLKTLKQNEIGQVAYNQTMNDSAQFLESLQRARTMGLNMNTRIGKQGMVIPEYQAGGVLGIDSSIIPDGALHKELNHMDQVNPEVDAVITEKGIPIVEVKEDGKLKQVCEIEAGEIIFTKILTEQLEALKNDPTDEDYIAAGKLIAEEIINNTQDNTNKLLDNGNEENSSQQESI